jgi:hypothetical protein
MMIESFLLIALCTAAIIIPAVIVAHRELRETGTRFAETKRGYDRRAS